MLYCVISSVNAKNVPARIQTQAGQSFGPFPFLCGNAASWRGSHLPQTACSRTFPARLRRKVPLASPFSSHTCFLVCGLTAGDSTEVPDASSSSAFMPLQSVALFSRLWGFKKSGHAFEG